MSLLLRAKTFTKRIFTDFSKEIIAGVAAALVTFIVTYFGRDKEVMVNGAVFETKQSRRPVANATIRFLNRNEEMTDNNGNFTSVLKGTKPEEVTIVVALPDGQTMNRKFSVDYTSDTIFLDPIEFPVDNNQPVIILGASSAKKETPASQANKPAYKELPVQQTTIPPVALSENGLTGNAKQQPEIVREGLLSTAIDNGVYSAPVALKFRQWSGNVLPGITTKGILATDVAVNQVLSGDFNSIEKNQSFRAARYVAVLKCETGFKQSTVDEALIVASIKAQVNIMDMEKKEIIFSINKTEKASGISEESAREEAEKALFNYLATTKL